MPDPVYFLTADDLQAVQALLDDNRGVITNRRSNHARSPLGGQAGEMFLARTPAGGIPPIIYMGTGTQEYLGTADAADQVGYARCNIYNIVWDSGTSKYIINKSSVTQSLVYNYNLYTIYDRYVPIVKDKYGSWMVAMVNMAGEGKATEPIPSATWGHVEVWEGPLGEETGTGRIYKMFNLRGPDVEIDDWVTFSTMYGQLCFVMQCSAGG